MGKFNSTKITHVETNDDETESQIDNFGVNFIFERALRRLDVQAEQRKLQQEKFDSQLKQFSNDNQMMELRLTNKDKDLDKLHEKCTTIQKQMVVIKTEKDILDMKLQAELKTTHRLSRDVENLQWTKTELLDMINRSRNIEELRQKILSRRLY